MGNFVLKHRTSLILGELDRPYEVFWQEAQRQFPEWIGFAPERTAPNPELARFYSQERARVLQELDEVSSLPIAERSAGKGSLR